MGGNQTTSTEPAGEPQDRRWWRRSDTKRLVAIGAISTMAVVGTALAINPSLPSSLGTALTAAGDTMPCYDMVSVAIAGRNDVAGADTPRLVAADGSVMPAVDSTNYSSRWLDPVVNKPRDSADSYAAVYVDYPANMSSYEDAVNTGVDNAKTVISQIRANCPDTQFAIVGYSEGADVARRVAQEVGTAEPTANGDYEVVDPNKVVGVVILADPGRDPGEGAFPGSDNEYNRPDGYDVDYRTGDNAASGGGSMPDTGGGFGALDGKVASFCVEGDLTCDAPENIALLQLAINVGRQMDVDAYERDGLTVPTGLDMAGVIGRISMLAFAEIGSQENWMASDQTFLDVLVKVSDPNYVPDTPIEDVQPGVILFNQLQNIAYLPQKVRNEVVGFVVDNQNTIPVAMNDPYGQTLGADGKHFDYWTDADPANGQPVSSAEYAANWLVHLAQQADERDTQNLAAASARGLAVSDETSSTADTTSSSATSSSATLSDASSSATSSSATSSGSSSASSSAAVSASEPAAATGDAQTSSEAPVQVPAPSETVTADTEAVSQQAEVAPTATPESTSSEVAPSGDVATTYQDPALSLTTTTPVP